MSEIVSDVPAYRMSLQLKIGLTMVMALGLLSLKLLFVQSSNLGWFHVLIGSVLFLSFGLGGLFFTAVQFLTSAKWSVVLRRIMESMALTLGVSAVLIATIYMGLHEIYIWSHPEEAASLHNKIAFLDPCFFGLRLALYFVVWFLGAWILIGDSFKQDKSGDPSITSKNFKRSAVFMVFFALSASMAAFDLLMSLEPHWFSTIFGIYFFAGFFQASLAMLLILTWLLYRAGTLKDFVSLDHFHDIARFLFGFSVFWAYIGFSQFMLIWYGNLPEETFYFKERMNHGWEWISLLLLLVRFFVPFLVLLPYGAKRCFKVTIPIAALVIFGEWLDLYWISIPALRHFEVEVSAWFGWKEIFVGLGFVSFFLLVVGLVMERIKMVPLKDPRLESSVQYYHHG